MVHVGWSECIASSITNILRKYADIECAAKARTKLQAFPGQENDLLALALVVFRVDLAQVLPIDIESLERRPPPEQPRKTEVARRPERPVPLPGPAKVPIAALPLSMPPKARRELRQSDWANYTPDGSEAGTPRGGPEQPRETNAVDAESGPKEAAQKASQICTKRLLTEMPPVWRDALRPWLAMATPLGESRFHELLLGKLEEQLAKQRKESVSKMMLATSIAQVLQELGAQSWYMEQWVQVAGVRPNRSGKGHRQSHSAEWQQRKARRSG